MQFEVTESSSLHLPTRQSRKVVSLIVVKLFFLFLCLSISLQAQTSESGRTKISGMFKKLSINAAFTSFKSKMLTDNNLTAMGINVAAIKQQATEKILLQEVPLSNKISVDMDLHEYQPFSKDAVITTTGIHGKTIVTPTIKIYRGKIVGDPLSRVTLGFSDKFVMGSIKYNGDLYSITTPESNTNGNDIQIAIAYPNTDMPERPMNSGVNEETMKYLAPAGYADKVREYWNNPKNQLTAADEKKFLNRQMSSEVFVKQTLKMAIDCDYEFYTNSCNSDIGVAYDYAALVMATTSEAFERDLETQLQIGYLNVWDADIDPYTETAASNFLSQASNHWATRPEERGLVHILTGKNMGSVLGIAWLKTLCRRDNGCALSAALKQSLHEDSYVVSQEIGHNFGLLHTHSCTWNPQIDQCAAAEEGNCFSQIIKIKGTIMSYCGNVDLVFHPKCSKYAIETLIPGVPCMYLSKILKTSEDIVQLVFPKEGGKIKYDTTLVGFFSNTGRQPVTVKSINFVGDQKKGWTHNITDVPFVLQPGESRDFGISYQPDTVEIIKARVEIEHDGYNKSPSILIVEAYFYRQFDKTIQPRLGLVAPDKEIKFKKTKLGFEADTAILRFYKNIGNLTLNVSKTELVGQDADQFDLVSGVAPFELKDQVDGQNIRVKFKPTSPGIKTCWLRVTSNSVGGLDSVKITGEAIKGSVFQFNVDRLNINFGKREKNILYDTNFVAFMINVGTDTGYIAGDLIGKDSADFTSNIEFNELAPGATQSLKVSLFATKDGFKTAFIQLLIFSDINAGTVAKTDTIYLSAAVGNVKGVDEDRVATGKLEMLPNPTKGMSKVSFEVTENDLGKDFLISISDKTGAEVYSTKGVCNSLSMIQNLDFNSLSSGNYTIIIRTAKKAFKGDLILVK